MSEKQKEERKKQKDIGQFFTPQIAVEFIYDMLKVQLDREEKWVKGKFPSIIDPACGEGVFLKIALNKRITKPNYVFGIDIDEKVKEKWADITLLEAFGSKAKLDVHFYHQNGLLPLPKKTLRYKKGGLAEYDLVVGNPPYGGVGVQEIPPELHDALLKYEIWRRAMKKNGKDDGASLFTETPEILGKTRQDRLKKFPIEILFLERFIQLVKPGGYIAIIVPDGILSNSNLHYVREYIAEKVKIDAIVSLPRETFKDAGTSAKTSIFFMTKTREDEKLADNYRVFLASVEKLENLSKVYEHYKEANQMNLAKKDLVKIINNSERNEVAMVRADKTLKEMMEEKPSSRWSVPYWHPYFEDLIKQVREYPTVLLDKHRDEIKSGYRSGNVKFVEKGYPYLQVRNILETGIDIFNADKIPFNSPARQGNKKVNQGDILLNRSGEGSVGRVTVCLGSDEIYVGGHVYRFSVKDISPIYVTVFLKTEFGRQQIYRFESGVSGKTEIDLDEILHIEIPKLDHIIDHIESEYKKMSAYHDKAMEAKAEGNDHGYKKNIKTAEKMLKELITCTEAVIRGEKKDVI